MNLINGEKNGSSRIQVSGYLSPIEWDQDDNPSKFSLYTDFGEDIILENLSKRKALKKFSGKKLSACGKFYEDQFGDKHLIVTKLKKNADSFELLAS